MLGGWRNVVYRRPVYLNVKKVGERPSFYFEAKTEHGWKSLCTHTSNKKTAQRIEHMWSELAAARAWDLLAPVWIDARKIGALYDQWTATKGTLADMRRLAADVNVEPFVAEWSKVMTTQTGADWTAHALAHVRHFFPAGVTRMVSAVSADWLTTALSEYPGKRNTRRKVHSSLSVFFDYLTVTKKLFAANPMTLVARPAQEFAPPVFYDAVTAMRIVKWQPTAERRALFALIYGTGADVSPAIAVEREDFNAATKEVRIAGTKTAYRDRVVRVTDAMWPLVWAHVKTVLSGPVFPATWNRWTVSDWHRWTVGEGRRATKTKTNPKPSIIEPGMKLAKQLPLRKARHHFAVRLLQSNAPIRVVAEQLGSDERTILRHYGPWITSSEDRARAEKMANQHETKRRNAR